MNQSNKTPKMNLVSSLKRNLKAMKPFRKMLYLAIMLTMLSAIISILAPSRLSLLTDEISNSLNIDVEKMQELSLRINDNLNSEKPSQLQMDGQNITIAEQEDFLETLADLQNRDISFSPDDEVSKEDQEYLLSAYGNMPKSITNIIEGRMDRNVIVRLAVTLVIMYLLSALLQYLHSLAMTETINNYGRKLRNDVAEKINKLPLNYFDTNKIGDILSRMTNDVDQITMNLNNSLGTITTSTTLLIGSIIMMFITNWKLALIAIFSSSFGFIFTAIIINKSQKYFKQRQEVLGDINGHTEEIVSGIEVVKIYNAKTQSNEKFNTLNDNLFKASVKSKFLSNMLMPIMMFIGNLGYLAVSISGAIFATNGEITFGVIVAFMTYVRLFTNPLSQISQAMGALQSSAAASDRVFEFMDEKELSNEDNINSYLNPNDVKGEIEFKDVVFQYPSNDEPTIKGFSAKATPGQKIAIVGPTGAGKSTMVNLLMKFYEISEGSILIDGHSIHDISRANIHDLFTMILQDTWLFHGSVRENIVYNMEGITDQELEALLEFIGLKHFIQTMPKGLDTIIKSNDSVSAGQRQLLTIARGMLKDAPFLILDEATSNVDTRTEEVIQEAMDKLMYGKTSFIIAHRLSTIVNSDLILVMKDGNIIEQGKHEELMNKNGFYADLYNSQFSLN